MRFLCMLSTLLLMTISVFHAQAQFRLGDYAGPHYSSVSTDSPVENSGMTALSAGLIAEYPWESRTTPLIMAHSPFRLGVYAGPHFSSVSTDSPVENSGMTAFSAGLIAEYSWESGLRIGLEPGYIARSVLLEEIAIFDDVEMTADYISIPLLLSYDFNMQPVQPYLTAGVSIDVLLSAEEKLNNSWEDISDYVAKTDVSLNVGAGVLIPVGSSHVFIELRYLHGLVNVSEEKGNFSMLGYNMNYDVMTRGILLSAGYCFAL